MSRRLESINTCCGSGRRMKGKEIIVNLAIEASMALFDKRCSYISPGKGSVSLRSKQTRKEICGQNVNVNC